MLLVNLIKFHRCQPLQIIPRKMTTGTHTSATLSGLRFSPLVKKYSKFTLAKKNVRICPKTLINWSLYCITKFYLFPNLIVQASKQANKQTNKQTNRTDRRMDGRADGLTNTKTNRQTDTQTERQTYTSIDRNTKGQIYRQDWGEHIIPLILVMTLGVTNKSFKKKLFLYCLRKSAYRHHYLIMTFNFVRVQ